MMKGASDIRYEIFRELLEKSVTAVLIAEREGVLSGIERGCASMESLGLGLSSDLFDGSPVTEDQEIARVCGNPVQIAMAEERIIGALSKSSGIATAARRAREETHSSCRVVSGGSKKMPVEIKDHVRKAALDGGIDVSILPTPFVYLDKNYVRILGGIKGAIQAVLPLKKSVVIQVRGETDRISNEAVEAAETGARVIMVDTGCQEDADHVIRALKEKGLRSGVTVAFAGNIALEALGRVDPQAKMPYILKFKKGEGRHHRDGVRIGVGTLEQTLIICLPGPHDEVRLAWPILREGMKEGWDKETLAGALADVLRKKFLDRSNGHRSH